MDKIDKYLTIPARIQDFLDENKIFNKFYDYLNSKELSNFKLYKDATELFFSLFNLKLNTSYIYIPFLIVLPLHTYNEKFLTDSTVTSEPTEINEESEGYTIRAGKSIRTYQRYIDIDGEFYKHRDEVGWKSLSLGLPDALNLTWETLALLRNGIPAFYFSNKMGKLIGGSNLFTKMHSGDSRKRAMIMLDKIEVGVSSDNEKMIINARIFESFDNIYDSGVMNRGSVTDLARKTKELYKISKNANYPILSGKY